jgi:hypothetical protein
MAGGLSRRACLGHWRSLREIAALSLAHVVAVNDSTEFLVKASLYDGDALAMRNTSLLKRFEALGILDSGVTALTRSPCSMTPT